MLNRVATKCPNPGGPGEAHEHVQLNNGPAKKGQFYPRRLCQAVCEGIASQNRIDELGLKAVPLVSVEELTQRFGNDPSNELHEQYEDYANECSDLYSLKAYDETSGEEIDIDLLRGARREEIKYFRGMNVYTKVPLSECYEETGQAPIGVKWVDINKGDKTNPNYRSRLAAEEFETVERPQWHAVAPPSECLKLCLHRLAGNRKQKMLYADVSRAYFYAASSRAVYVKLPGEDWEEGDDGKCGRLNVSMYGTRGAALNWAEEYAQKLVKAGFRRGISNPCLFWHSKTKVTIMVHGDDFLAVGEEAQLDE